MEKEKNAQTKLFSESIESFSTKEYESISTNRTDSSGNPNDLF
jgi:hypothetical protein